MNPLTTKLQRFTSFTGEEKQRLDALVSGKQESYRPRKDILTEGDHVDEIHLVVSGLAARYKILPDGSRQIMAFLIPGDLCDIEVFVLEEMDHSVAAVSETVCAVIPADTVKGLLTEMSSLTQALWWSTMTDSAVLRERIIDHGRRDARERLAHLFYEMLIRYRMIDQAEDDTIPFPLTQEDLADATGLTPVHVNRTLQQLRGEGLIELENKRLKVLDRPRLKQVARFNPNYLHIRRAEADAAPPAERPLRLVSADASAP
jgi:CRP-like cAMP-binding protein